MPRGTGPVIDQDSNAVLKKINRALERAGKIHSHSIYMVSSWIKIVMICKKWWQKPVDTLCVHSSIPPLNISPTYHPFQPSSPPTPGKLWVRYSPVAGDAGKKNPSSCPQGAHSLFSRNDSKEYIWFIFPQITYCKSGRYFALLLLSWDQQHLCQRASSLLEILIKRIKTVFSNRSTMWATCITLNFLEKILKQSKKHPQNRKWS